MDEKYETLIHQFSSGIQRERALPVVLVLMVFILSAIEGIILFIVLVAISQAIPAKFLINHSVAFGGLFVLDVFTLIQFLIVNRWNGELRHLDQLHHAEKGSIFKINWRMYSKAGKIVAMHGILLGFCILFVVLVALTGHIEIKGNSALAQVVKIYELLTTTSIGIVLVYAAIEFGYLVKWGSRMASFLDVNQVIRKEVLHE